MNYITTTEDLKKLCKDIKQTTDIVAIDTEFDKHNSYFPIICIVQIGYFDGVEFKKYIVDMMIKEMDLKPFESILQSKKIKKVIHSLSEDILAFYYKFKFLPNALEDTQLMAEFCGYRHSMGYANAVTEILNVSLVKDKKMQKSDWKKRPLSQKQLEYAEGDVEYLLEMYEILNRKIIANNNMDLYNLKLEEKTGKHLIENLIENSWRKIRSSFNEKTFEYLDKLKVLASYRETIAMKLNKIRELVLKDSIIKEIAKKSPKNMRELNNLLYGEKINLLTKEDKRKISEYLRGYKINSNSNKLFFYTPRNKKEKNKLNTIKNIVNNKCIERNIAPDSFINKMEIMIIINNYNTVKKEFTKLQYKLFGKEVENILKN